MSEEQGLAYKALRVRVSEIVRAVPASTLDAPSPATPGWSVRDVLAHLVGVTNDVVSGRVEGIASDAWTSAQVDARATASVAQLIEEWDDYGPKFEARLTAAPPEIAGQALFDGATHEHDIRHALGVPGARDSDAMAIGWTWLVDVRTRGGAAPLRFVTEFEDVAIDTGVPLATVEASRFELFRASSGRRTAAEIEAYTWSPGPRVDLILGGPIFQLRSHPLSE